MRFKSEIRGIFKILTLNLHLQKTSIIHFFLSQSEAVFVLQTEQPLSATDITKLEWLFGGAKLQNEKHLNGFFVGPRAAMITPWSTNAVEITQNMSMTGIIRIEEFQKVTEDFSAFDPMLSQKYNQLRSRCLHHQHQTRSDFGNYRYSWLQ